MSCPFYAVALVLPHDGSGAVLIPIGGNRCGLVTSAHAPCAMEMEGHAPDWIACPRNPDNVGWGIPRAARGAFGTVQRDQEDS
jgi:hypothetical protein